jgi:hypothetical protein
MQTTRPVTIRRTGNTTLRIAIPREFVVRQGLDEGDQCVWQEEDNGVRLKFVKLAELAELVKSAAA